MLAGFSRYLSQLIVGWTQLETSLGSVSRIRSFEMDVEPEAKSGEQNEPSASWPDRGAIEFREVTASHKYVSQIDHNTSILTYSKN